MVEIVYELKAHHCMFYDQTVHQNESLLFGLNSPLHAIRMNLPSGSVYWE